MKMRTPHTVPLLPQAIEVLQTLHTVTGGRELLFPGERDHEKCMSNNTILKALERMGYKGQMTGHGFRGIASTVLHEHGFDHAHIELQLAHTERNEVSAAIACKASIISIELYAPHVPRRKPAGRVQSLGILLEHDAFMSFAGHGMAINGRH